MLGSVFPARDVICVASRVTRASFIPFLTRPDPDVFLTYPGLCHPFFFCIKIRSLYAMGSFLYALRTTLFDVPDPPAFPLPTPWPGKSNVAPPGQGALCPTGLHEQIKAKRQLLPKPAGQGRRNWDRSEAESPSPRPSGGLLRMWDSDVEEKAPQGFWL